MTLSLVQLIVALASTAFVSAVLGIVIGAALGRAGALAELERQQELARWAELSQVRTSLELELVEESGAAGS